MEASYQEMGALGKTNTYADEDIVWDRYPVIKSLDADNGYKERDFDLDAGYTITANNEPLFPRSSIFTRPLLSSAIPEPPAASRSLPTPRLPDLSITIPPVTVPGLVPSVIRPVEVTLPTNPAESGRFTQITDLISKGIDAFVVTKTAGRLPQTTYTGDADQPARDPGDGAGTDLGASIGRAIDGVFGFVRRNPLVTLTGAGALVLYMMQPSGGGYSRGRR